ncbi:MAG TPA: hypothetical protein VGR93_12525 [Candidatus Acidoferrales bacterium]|nr:hypothetical protein [Candidatus Acidoferrales bacterium]
MMRLSIKGLALAGGLLWDGGILCLGLIHLANAGYGAAFLAGISSVYPGFMVLAALATRFSAESMHSSMAPSVASFLPGCTTPLRASHRARNSRSIDEEWIAGSSLSIESSQSPGSRA